MAKKALVLYSGGLDSRLAVKIMQEQGFSVTALHFNLPFGCGCCNQGCNFSFTQKEGVTLRIIDVTKEPLLSEYLSLVEKPSHGRGASINPCKDCKIFIFRHAKKIFDEEYFDVIASGEVLGQRPMSQTSAAKKIIDKKLGFEILRPLSAKLLPETKYETSGLIDRSKLYDIVGRKRTKQEELAKKYGFTFPTPGGGCFLCEKPAKRILSLLKHKLLNESTLKLSLIGRHFMKEDCWFVVARNEKECFIIESFIENYLKSSSGTPAVYYSNTKEKHNAIKLKEAYSKGASEELKNKLRKWSL